MSQFVFISLQSSSIVVVIACPFSIYIYPSICPSIHPSTHLYLCVWLPVPLSLYVAHPSKKSPACSRIDVLRPWRIRTPPSSSGRSRSWKRPCWHSKDAWANYRPQPDCPHLDNATGATECNLWISTRPPMGLHKVHQPIGSHLRVSLCRMCYTAFISALADARARTLASIRHHLSASTPSFIRTYKMNWHEENDAKRYKASNKHNSNCASVENPILTNVRRPTHPLT